MINHNDSHLNAIKRLNCHVRIRNNLIGFPIIIGYEVNVSIAR